MFKKHVHWSSRLSYIMAGAGAAVGLGNIWRFPYLAGLNGGGAFVLMYIGFVLLIGIPLMASEVLIGRRGSKNAADAFKEIAVFRGSNRLWALAGFWQILAGFLVLSYYTVIAGWVLHYIVYSFTGTFHNISQENTNQLFANLLASPMMLLFWDTLVVLAIVGIIAKGIHKGLEKAIWIMFPAFLILVLVLIFYATETGSFKMGLQFLFRPDFSKVGIQSVLLALGQAFFSLGIGMAIMFTYGTYVHKDTSIVTTSIQISAMDTIIALVAGMTIFPIVFANNLSPSAGPSLIFKSLPMAFGHMPMGEYFAALFFIMLEFAALTSAIALLEPAVMFLIERYEWTRPKATAAAGFTIWVVSIGTVVSFNIGSQQIFFGMTFFDFLDFVTANIMLPVGGLLTAIFTGWVMYRQDTSDELHMNHKHRLYKMWRLSMKFIAPIAIVFIFAKSVGII